MATGQDQFDALVRATSGDLFRYAVWLTGQRALAEDLVQETYLRAWKALDELRDAQAAKPWLITILRREHARHHEKLGNRPATDLADVADQLAEEITAAPDADGDLMLLRRAIAQLKPKYREPLVMQVLGGFSCEEIAAELGISAATVMVQLFRARQQLKSAFAADAARAGGGDESA